MRTHEPARLLSAVLLRLLFAMCLAFPHVAVAQPNARELVRTIEAEELTPALQSLLGNRIPAVVDADELLKDLPLTTTRAFLMDIGTGPLLKAELHQTSIRQGRFGWSGRISTIPNSSVVLIARPDESVFGTVQI